MKSLQMNGKNRLQKWIGMMITICACLLFSVTALAAESGVIQITQTDTQTKEPVGGIKLTIYQVAEASGDTVSGFSITSDFASLGLDLDSLGEPEAAEAAVAQLDSLIEAKQLQGIKTLTTGSDGKAVFDGLADGIYLVKQTNTEADFEELGYTYETESYLVSLPRTGENGTQTRTAICQPKGTLVPEELTELTVYKVWKDNNNKYGKRPESINVGLYLDDELQEEVQLSAVNNWRHAWTELDPDGTWTVKELNVPEGYTSEITNEGTAVTITNTYKVPKTPKTPGNSRTGRSSGGSPKTGDNTPLSLWIGLAAVSAGVIWLLIRRKKNSN
ncbi:MAG: Cna B-type domain-containing protein [Lachnospiraceae bacterium]|nr:Cna B-type domain-containing protein [Lachnospiraceae bacterium]